MVVPLLVSLCYVLSPFMFRLLFRHLRRRAANRSVRPLDLSAFRALLDGDDEAFLREKLSRAEFFRLKRLRIKVIRKYARRIADNSAIVLRSVASSRHDPDVNVAQTAMEVENLAAQIRVHCRLAFAKLTVEYMFPAIRLRKYRS